MTYSKTRKVSRKSQPTKGWAKKSPGTHQRTVMLRKCGKRCFLGPKKSFPICNKGTCRVNPKGVYSAYIRAREWGKPRYTYKTSKPTHKRQTYSRIATKAKRILKDIFGYKNVGKDSKRRSSKRSSKRRSSKRKSSKRKSSKRKSSKR
jgi:hypothetical protein